MEKMDLIEKEIGEIKEELCFVEWTDGTEWFVCDSNDIPNAVKKVEGYERKKCPLCKRLNLLLDLLKE